MSKINRAYGIINGFTWGVISMYGYLQQKSFIENKYFKTNWVNNSDLVANILMDEYSEVSVQLPYLMEFCDRFTEEISEDFRKTAFKFAERFESSIEGTIVYYQYIITLLRIFEIYSEIMEHVKLKTSLFYDNYKDNKNTFDEFISLIRLENLEVKNEIMVAHQDKSKKIIKEIESKTEQLIIPWKKELLNYIGDLNN